MKKIIRIMPFAFFLLLLLPLGLTAQNAGNEYVCYEDNGSPYASDVSCAQYTCYDEFGAPFTSSLSCEYAEKANACSCNHCHQQVTCYESCSNPQCPSNMCPCNLCLVEYTCGTVHECAPPENEEDEEDGVSIPKGGGGGGSSGTTKMPCSSSTKANPLVTIQILGTPNCGIKGGDFGTGRGRMHNGIDLAGTIGTPVYATHDGTVIKVVSTDPTTTLGWDEYMRQNPEVVRNKSVYNDLAAGKRVNIDCGNGLVIKNFHLQSTVVKSNTKVKKGDLIGYLGNTGSCSSKSSAGPHLHYEIRLNNIPVDPKSYLYSTFNIQGKGSDCIN